MSGWAQLSGSPTKAVPAAELPCSIRRLGYDRDTIVQRHYEDSGTQCVQVSLAQDDGSA